MQSVGIDWMHTVCLGVLQFLLWALVWALFLKNPFNFQGAGLAVTELSFTRLRTALFAWYEEEEKAGRKHTRPQQLTSTFFGSRTQFGCKLHAAETLGFARFMLYCFLPRYGVCLRDSAPLFLLALSSVVGLADLVKLHPRVFPPSAQQEFCEHVAVHIRTVKLLGIYCRPKHHFLIELAGRCMVLKLHVEFRCQAW